MLAPFVYIQLASGERMIYSREQYLELTEMFLDAAGREIDPKPEQTFLRWLMPCGNWPIAPPALLIR